MSPRTVRLLRRILRRCLHWIDDRYCFACDAKLVLYKNNRWDCAHLRDECKREMGGIA